MSRLDEAEGCSVKPAAKHGIGVRVALFRHLVRRLRYGRLQIVLPDGSRIEAVGAQPGPEASISVRCWRVLRRVVTAGDIGFAESYLDGDWNTPDLTAVIRLAARNSKALARTIDGNPAMRLVNRIGHLFKANTKRGSRRNIEAHYDLGNDFYKLWLDRTMLYSSALFYSPISSLEAAQQHKLDRIRERLALEGGEHILEIGCGWGTLAAELAETSDANVTAITLSPSQLEWATAVAASSGRGDRIDLRLQDYRDIDGHFDRIVSIEMFEAVGKRYWPVYFDTIRRCLKPGGSAVFQIISIEDSRYQAYDGGVDFIQKYIFPGGFLPSDRALGAAISAAGLKLTAVEHFGKSYARTLREWRSRFFASWSDIAAQGFDDRFKRLWTYYLCYCEAGFEEGSIDVGLYTLTHA